MNYNNEVDCLFLYKNIFLFVTPMRYNESMTISALRMAPFFQRTATATAGITAATFLKQKKTNKRTYKNSVLHAYENGCVIRYI